MKLNKFLKYTAVSALALTGLMSVNSCTDDFEKLNTNPYEVDPTSLPFAAQFKEPFSYVYAPQQNMFQFWTNLSVDLFSGYFMTPHNFGGSGNVQYNLNRGFCGGMYENVYSHIFNNTRTLIKSCDEKGYKDYAGMMRVVQAYAISMLTDSYGPVAYSTVIDDPTNGVSYAYDSQEQIYNSLFTLLDEAIAGFKSSTSDKESMASFDYWCGGNMNMWIKVANQFKLRFAMRIVKANPSLAQQKAEEAVAGGVLNAEDKDVLINQGLTNELYRMYYAWGDCGTNANLITIMEGMQDPRLPLYMTKNFAGITCEDGSIIEEGTRYLGIRPGHDIVAKPNEYVNYSYAVLDYTTPLPVMFAAESYFLRAEGALRGWNMGGTAKDFYEEGIRTSIKHQLAYKGPFVTGGISISDAEIEAFINNTASQEDLVDPVNSKFNHKAMNTVGTKWNESASKEEKLQQIILQKWVANFPLSTEAWAEYRRTGYPKLFPNYKNNSDGTIDTDEQIRRLIYSNNEINTNNEELQNGIKILNQENTSAKFSGDLGGTRVWWDQAGKGNF